jgi:muramidase (phage lysozyme)/murein DD-endopeptidase MepM/ murein hydrolase activator NlpD
MRLRVPQVRVNIANRFTYQNNDGFLQSTDVTLGEQERASSCTVSVFDPELKLLNLLLTEFQRVGGIIVPKGLLGEEKKEEVFATSTDIPSLTNDPNGYLRQLEQKYGLSDLSGLTPVGRKAYQALSNSNVRAFLDAIAIAELGENAAAKGGYGYLFGDVGGTETFDPRTLKEHPRKSRPFAGGSSNATGRYQIITVAWDDDTAYGRVGIGLKDMKPISQEIFAVARMMFREILDPVLRGDVEAALEGNGKKGNGASWEWASLEPRRYPGQGTSGGRKSTFIANFNRFKQVASSKSPTPSTTSTTGLPSASDALAQLKSPDKKTDATSLDVSQGTRLFIEMGFTDTELTTYEFLLTDVRGSDSIPHSTQIQGRQVRAIAAKSPKAFAVYRNTTIRQLANQIAAGVGAEVEIVDAVDIDKVMTVVKKNETDYQALVKAAKTIGLFVRGNASTIKLEPLKASDKVRFVNKDIMLPGSSWGDSASSDRRSPFDTPAPPSTSVTTSTGGNGIVSNGGVFTPVIRAFMDLIAWKEVPDSLALKSYYANNFSGYFTDQDIADGGGFPKTAGTTQNVGRYQFNRGDWQDAKTDNPAIKGYSPAEQDLVCYYKLKVRNVLEPLATNDLSLAIKRAGIEWASLPGSPYGQVQAGYSESSAIDYYRSRFSASSPTATSNSLPTATTELSKLQPTANLNKAGILDLKTAADEKKGVGKGFEGQLQILSVLQPDVLTWQPGEIVKSQTGFGEAIDREYRVSQVKHSWAQGALASTISIYLPVAIVVKQDSTPIQGGAVTGSSAFGSPEFDNWNVKWKKAAVREDVIVGTGRRVTSPFGMRKHPVTGEFKIHNGTDVDCPSGTKIYPVCKPGESITAEYLPNQAGAGNIIRYQSGEYTFQVFHLSSGRSGTYQAGQIIGFTGSSGLGTGSHGHYEIYKTKEGASKRFPISLGHLYWQLTGNPPN